MLERYKPSGAMGGTAAVGMVAGAAAVGVLGTVYQAFIYFVPYVMITWLASFFFAMGAHFVVKRVVKQWHCRNVVAGAAIGLVAALVGVGVSHYVGFTLVVKGFPPIGVMGEYLRLRAEAGWVVGQGGSGSPLSGWFVYVVWGIEAAGISAAGLSGGVMGARMPYCEPCGTWADKVRGKFEVQSPKSEEITLVTDAVVVDELMAEEGGGAFGTALEYAVHECPKCAGVPTVNIKLRWTEMTKKGQAQIKRRSLHERVLLTAEDVEVVLGMAPGEVKA